MKKIAVSLLFLVFSNISANPNRLDGNYLCQNDQSSLSLTVKMALTTHEEGRVAYAIEWIEETRAPTPLMDTLAFICDEDRETLGHLADTRRSVRAIDGQREILHAGELLFLDKRTRCLTNSKHILLIFENPYNNNLNHLICDKREGRPSVGMPPL